MNGFGERFPLLYHVTSAGAVDRIFDQGLLPAAVLAARQGIPLNGHRDAWLLLPDGAMLRRQGMKDVSLASRLAPGLSPETWRGFINGMAFLFPDLYRAERLAASRRDVHVPQAILVFETQALLDANLPLRFCPFNNGFLDRSPPGKRRLRGFADYRPLAEWQRRLNVSEIAVPGGIPAGLGGVRLIGA